MKTVKIDRKKWGTQSLKNFSGRYCCLGFCALDAGLTDDDLLKKEKSSWNGKRAGLGMPSSLRLKARQQYRRAFPKLASYETKLADINDSSRRKHVKEKMIQELGAKGGVNFVFVN